MRPDLFLATIGRGSNGSNALEVTEDRAAVTAESQDNIINRVNNVSQYGPSWHYVPGIGVAGTAYAEVPGSALGDLAFTRASSKTRTNAAGVVETIGNNVPAHDYRNADGTLSTFPRLNLEPQRTNSIRNSSMVGAVAGTPGTLPTNWTQGNAIGGFTRTVVGIGTENGLPYIDIRYNGTANNTFGDVLFEASSVIASANAATWAQSAYIKLIAAPNPPLSTRFAFRQYNSALTFLGVTIGSELSVSSSLTRYNTSFTTNQATVAFVQPSLFFGFTNGATYDFTIRIAAPQMELGAYATTWVPTTTAAVTRLADLAEKTGVSSLIGQSQGTFFIECNVRAFAEVVALFALSDGTSLNRIRARRTAAQTITLERNLSGQSDQTVNFTSVPTSGSIKAAFAWSTAANGFAVYVNGTGNSSASALPMFTNQLSRISVGTLQTGGSALGDGVTQAALFTTRLANATLAQLTTL